jgi:hypothetical protein
MSVENIDYEVENIVKSYGFKFNDDVTKYLEEKKIPKDMIKKIKESLNERHVKLVKQAKKTADKIIDKYGDIDDISVEDYLERSKDLLMNKYDLKGRKSFKEFKKIIFDKMYEKQDKIRYPTRSTKFDKDYDRDDLKEIYKLYKDSYTLYKKVSYQSLTYVDLDVFTNSKRSANNNIETYNGINPVIFALYVFKFSAFEKYSLNSNLSRAIYNKYEDIKDKVDYDIQLIETID